MLLIIYYKWVLLNAPWANQDNLVFCLDDFLDFHTKWYVEQNVSSTVGRHPRNVILSYFVAIYSSTWPFLWLLRKMHRKWRVIISSAVLVCDHIMFSSQLREYFMETHFSEWVTRNVPLHIFPNNPQNPFPPSYIILWKISRSDNYKWKIRICPKLFSDNKKKHSCSAEAIIYIICLYLSSNNQFKF